MDRARREAKNIAFYIRNNGKKVEQFRKMADRCCYLTSDDGAMITKEIYDGGIFRYVVEGTRSSVTLTVNADDEIIRKPAGIKPLTTEWAGSIHIYDDILDEVEALQAIDAEKEAEIKAAQEDAERNELLVSLLEERNTWEDANGFERMPSKKAEEMAKRLEAWNTAHPDAVIPYELKNYDSFRLLWFDGWTFEFEPLEALEEEAPQIEEVKRWSGQEVMNYCIRADRYTAGDCYEYEKMLRFVDDSEPTTANIYRVAKDIAQHSDLTAYGYTGTEPEAIEGIMYDIKAECVKTFYTIK